MGGGELRRRGPWGSASFKRLVGLAEMMALAPDRSLPRQCRKWAELKGAYRLLSNPEVKPEALQQPHRQRTMNACRGRGVVLCVQDTADLTFTAHRKVKGLGPIGRGEQEDGPGGGRGIRQHSTLAVDPGRGALLGVLNQRLFIRTEVEEDETRAERSDRWRESLVWEDAARAAGPSPEGTRLIHVGDRLADVWSFPSVCEEMAAGFVIRAQHDRCVLDGEQRLWAFMAGLPVAATGQVKIGAHHSFFAKNSRPARTAGVELRFGVVELCVPKQCAPPGARPREVHAVFVHEPAPPKKAEPIDWMLLTSEPVNTVEDAWRIVEWYKHRWLIEEWHRALKEGCRIEASQLDHAEDLMRLAAIQGVIAARLLQIRDLADNPETAEDPEQLPGIVPESMIRAVAHLAQTPANKLTPKQFWRTIACRGGWLGRGRDPRPGWNALWTGWRDCSLIAAGLDMREDHGSARIKSCG